MKTRKEEKGNISWEQRNIEDLIKQEIDNMFDQFFLNITWIKKLKKSSY